METNVLDNALRPIKEKLLYPFAEVIGRFLSPNQVTFISFLCGLFSIGAIMFGSIKYGLIFWISNRIIDGLDGTVARVTNRQSDLGGYLDIMVDFVIYSLIPISFVLSRGNNTGELIFLSIMLASFYINAASWMYLSSILEKNGTTKDGSFTSVIMPTGIVEGFETIIIYTFFYIFPDKIVYLFLIMSLFTFLGAIQRVLWAYKKLN